ncbi:MAG: glutamine-hydrolyzing carbamoyl-phosphate synthase small subunit [Acidimicrobiia bacterium]|nr:glutamine-hydrolyzing carbamoyl-phosphate synthase small subunit [bacterium]MXX64235.1 glutamine-hydrolyzing carbamoyl-phosphate synthase small subunit [Acidimicrobiia bacterium]MDE0642783.1 glutamine-hydrolyzing carbamoyl-phosphate synthase small subunit [bacterium]MXZ07654.1 glutamine-hydrolyzing carbamoyl-phosphate synthase small subunit [Acidimicrobiia bacterium]MYD04459.1 glutamine-hydrolyzing carbamoyl-phosphate synthase small subunit [Acidimicrobiia bacterium]
MTLGRLVTADGEVFEGRSVGVEGVRVGEAVFNTSMTGYQEVLSDPSYAGQVVVMTSPHIGNYGVSSYDDQALRPAARGLIVRSLSRRHSNWRAEGTLAGYLRSHEMVAIADLDTRRLTRHLRDRGAMPVAIGAGVDKEELIRRAAQAPRMEGQDLATGVSTPHPYRIDPQGEARGRVVAIDLGMKRDIGRQLAARGLEVQVLPAACTAQDILDLDPTGVFLTNGPGDPEPLQHNIETVRSLLGRVPVFGICLGHQVIGLALGASTFKLPFGHHGGNHPVRRLADGRVEITAQNHGFAVDLWPLTGREMPERVGLAGPELLPRAVTGDFGEVRPTHQNLNDGTLEGLECLDIPALSVQYHPEAAPGPHDALGLFDDFLALMGLETEAEDA